MKANLYTDGASKGNPGPSSIGVVLITDNAKKITLSEYIGETTNNVAEYEAIIRGLYLALDAGVSEVTVYSDSLVVIKQIVGIISVSSNPLQDKFNLIHRILPKFCDCSFKWIPRDENKIADNLANQAILREKRYYK